MKNQKSYSFRAAILILIWTIYYYAKRSTGGIVDTLDHIVCGIVALICIIVIIKHIIDTLKKKGDVKKLD